jgi:hypothetical protein
MAAEETGRRKLTQFVTYHVLRNVHRYMPATIMDSQGMPHELGENGRSARPSFDNLTVALAIHLLNLLEETRGDEGAFL